MHLTRVLSAAVLIPPFLLLVQFGSPLYFSLLVALAAGLAAWEFARLCPAGSDPGLTLLAVGGALAWQAALLAGRGVPAVIVLVAGIGLVRVVFGSEGFRDAAGKTGWAVLATVYAGGFFGAASLLRGSPDGRQLIYFLVATTWAADIAAYYVGRSLGRRPLAPKASPKKTVEGSLGGLVGAAVVAAAGSGWAWPMPVVPALLLGALLAVVGMVGDLAESALKRGAGVKDSGGLIPGHGGVLDRLDSLAFAAPVLYGIAWLGLV